MQVKTVLFRNFSDQVFSAVEEHEVRVGDSVRMLIDENCKWDGEPYTFQPGESRYMADWKAAHFAKHLVNRELLKKGMENDTSPKSPKDNPRYMELFVQAYIEDPKSAPKSESMIEDEILNKNKDLEIEKLKAELAEARGAKVEEEDEEIEEEEKPKAPIQAIVKDKAGEKSELVTIVDEEDEEEEEAGAPTGSEEAGFAGLKVIQ